MNSIEEIHLKETQDFNSLWGLKNTEFSTLESLVKRKSEILSSWDLVKDFCVILDSWGKDDFSLFFSNQDQEYIDLFSLFLIDKVKKDYFINKKELDENIILFMENNIDFIKYKVKFLDNFDKIDFKKSYKDLYDDISFLLYLFWYDNIWNDLFDFSNNTYKQLINLLEEEFSKLDLQNSDISFLDLRKYMQLLDITNSFITINILEIDHKSWLNNLIEIIDHKSYEILSFLKKNISENDEEDVNKIINDLEIFRWRFLVSNSTNWLSSIELVDDKNQDGLSENISKHIDYLETLFTWYKYLKLDKNYNSTGTRQSAFLWNTAVILSEFIKSIEWEVILKWAELIDSDNPYNFYILNDILRKNDFFFYLYDLKEFETLEEVKSFIEKIFVEVYYYSLSFSDIESNINDSWDINEISYEHIIDNFLSLWDLSNLNDFLLEVISRVLDTHGFDNEIYMKIISKLISRDSLDNHFLEKHKLKIIQKCINKITKSFTDDTQINEESINEFISIIWEIKEYFSTNKIPMHYFNWYIYILFEITNFYLNLWTSYKEESKKCLLNILKLFENIDLSDFYKNKLNEFISKYWLIEFWKDDLVSDSVVYKFLKKDLLIEWNDIVSDFDSDLDNVLNWEFSNNLDEESFYNSIWDLIGDKLFYNICEVKIWKDNILNNVNTRWSEFKKINIANWYFLYIFYLDSNSSIVDWLLDYYNRSDNWGDSLISKLWFIINEDINYFKKYKDEITWLANLAKLEIDINKKNNIDFVWNFSYIEIDLLDLSSFLAYNKWKHSDLFKYFSKKLNELVSIYDIELYSVDWTKFWILLNNNFKKDDIIKLLNSIKSIENNLDEHKFLISIWVSWIKNNEDEFSFETLINEARISLEKVYYNPNDFYHFFDGLKTSANKTTFTDTKNNFFHILMGPENNEYWTIKIEFQDIVDKDRKVVKRESLARLELKNGDLIYPWDFLDILDKYNNLYPSFTEFIIDKVFEKASKDNIDYSININQIDLISNNFIWYLESTISKYNLDPSRICFEILESRLDLSDDIKNRLSKIKELWFKISLDDFWKDEANLDRVIELSNNNLLDYIKLDWKIVELICSNDEKDKLDYKKLIDFLKSSWIEIIAEYVDSEEKFFILKKLGINFFQWHFFII